MHRNQNLQTMELCDGITRYSCPSSQCELIQTISTAPDAPVEIGFCFSTSCLRCMFPVPPGMDYFLNNDVAFIVAILRNEPVFSSCVRRWDLMERFLLYVGAHKHVVDLFHTHRTNIVNPSDRLYSFFCLFDVTIKIPKLSMYECDSLMRFSHVSNGISKSEVIHFIAHNAESDVYYNEVLPSSNSIIKILPANIIGFLKPNEVVVAGGFIAQIKTPWAEVLPSSDIDVFVLQNNKKKLDEIIANVNVTEYIVCKSSKSVIMLIPKLLEHMVIQIILHDAQSTKELLETFDITSLKIAFDSQYLVYPYVAVRDWQERIITPNNCVIMPKRFLKMYLKGYKISNEAKEYVGKALGQNGTWPPAPDVIDDVRDMTYLTNLRLSASSQRVMLRALGFTFDIGNIVPMERTITGSYAVQSMNIISWECFVREKKIPNFNVHYSMQVKMITANYVLQMPVVIVHTFTLNKKIKLCIMKDEDVHHYALLQAIIRNSTSKNNKLIHHYVSEYMGRQYKEVMFICTSESRSLQGGIPHVTINFEGSMQIVAQLHCISQEHVIWKIHTLQCL